MDHLVLIGDSIFDNAPYVAKGCAVVDHLRHELRDEAEVTLLAVDGSFVNEVPRQLQNLPRGATHLFMSAGGNDALASRTGLDGFSLGSGASEHPADIETAGFPDLARDLEELPAAGRSYGNGIGGAMRRAFGEARATSSPGRRGPDSSRILKELGSATHLLDVLAVIQHEFVRDYESALGALRDTGLPAAVCTVYDAIPHLEPRYRTALSVFNDQIVRRAASAGLQIIDLRAVCNEDTDYSPASPIEPSDPGGRKIAKAIARVYRKDRAAGRVAEIWMLAD